MREAGVAVGMYDLTFLEYPFHEAAKFEQLTGELFAEGLSGALNIDRNSFNETDDVYLDLVKWFHGKLNKEVFPQIKKEMKGKIIEDIADNISKLIMAYGRRDKKDYRINFERMGKKEHLFHKKGTALTVNMDHPEGRLNKKKMDRFLLAAILVLENIVSHEDIEMILQEVTRTQKEIKQHG